MKSEHDRIMEENMIIDTPTIPRKQDTPAQKRLSSFFVKLAKETRVSKCAARLELARKQKQRSQLIDKRRKQRERMRKQAKELETTEAQIQLTDEDIEKLKAVVEDGTDGEDE